MGRAMRTAKLRDIKATTGIAVNTNFAILHFSDAEIIENDYVVGVSLGTTGKEVWKYMNELLDLEVDRAWT